MFKNLKYIIFLITLLSFIFSKEYTASEISNLIINDFASKGNNKKSFTFQIGNEYLNSLDKSIKSQIETEINKLEKNYTVFLIIYSNLISPNFNTENQNLYLVLEIIKDLKQKFKKTIII